MDVFDAVHEKGSREWRTFEAIRGDLRDTYSRAPKEAPERKRPQPGYIDPIPRDPQPLHPTPEFGR